MTLGSKAAPLLALLSAALGLAGCGGAAVTLVSEPGKARPSDCPLEFLYKRPSAPHEDIAMLHQQVNAVPPGGAVEVLRAPACKLGADAVVITRNQVLDLFDHVMVEGTAIRFVAAPAKPAEPPPEAAPAAATPPAPPPAAAPAATPPPAAAPPAAAPAPAPAAPATTP